LTEFKPQEARNSSLKNSEFQQPVQIAYLLTVNGRASRQVRRLINILYHPSHLFYIHVDAVSTYQGRELFYFNLEKIKTLGIYHETRIFKITIYYIFKLFKLFF